VRLIGSHTLLRDNATKDILTLLLTRGNPIVEVLHITQHYLSC